MPTVELDDLTIATADVPDWQAMIDEKWPVMDETVDPPVLVENPTGAQYKAQINKYVKTRLEAELQKFLDRKARRARPPKLS